MSKLAGFFEHTGAFVLFLFIFVLGAMMASRVVGAYVRPTSTSLGSALQSA
jgi:hypothetical protein